MKLKHLILSVVALLGFGLADSAHASCERFVDQAGILNKSTITNSAQNLTSKGADVFVRTYNSFGSFGTLDQVINAEIHTCANMQNATGNGRKSNLVILAVAMHPHASGMYLGSQYVNSITPHDSDIRGRVMNSYLRDGNFNLAFSAALDRIGHYIDVSNTVSTTPVVVNQEAPTDYREAGKVIYTVLGIMLFLGLLIAGFVWYFSVKCKKQKVTAAKNELDIIIARTTDQVNKLTDEGQTKLAIGETTQERVDEANRIVETYAGLVSKAKSLPDDTPIESYNLLSDSFISLNNRLLHFTWGKTTPVVSTTIAKPTQTTVEPKDYHSSSFVAGAYQVSAPLHTTPTYTSPIPAPVVYIPTQSTNVVVVNETIEDTYVEPVHHKYHSSNSYASSSDSSSDYSSNNSWGSDSSSSWDSGSSSSDFSSGSDDSSGW